MSSPLFGIYYFLLLRTMISCMTHYCCQNRERAMIYPGRGKVAYLVDTKVCIRVEVVVTGGHLIWAEEFGHLAPAGTGRQAGGMGCVWRSRRPRSMLDRRHRLGQRGGLCRLRRNYADWLSLWLRLLVREETTEERACEVHLLLEDKANTDRNRLKLYHVAQFFFIHSKGLAEDLAAIPRSIFRLLSCLAAHLSGAVW